MRSTKGHKIAVLDTETDPFLADRVPIPFAAGFWDGSLYLEEWGDGCLERLLIRISELPDDYVIYCHNGGRFDFWFMLDWIDETRQSFIINGRLTEFSLAGSNHIFRDSMAIFPFALSAYQKDEIDYTLFERDKRERNKAKILDYMKSDCVYLFHLVDRFSMRFADAKGNTPISIGQASVRELMRLHPFQKMTEASDAEIRPWYMGGRVQCFAGGILKGPWRAYDVNSMYLHAMKEYEHPLSDLYENLDRPPRFQRAVWFAEFEGSNRQAIPIAPDDKTGGIDFTVRQGTFRACSHELVPALAAGLVTVDKWITVLRPSEQGSFDKFVDMFSDEKIAAKANGDKVGELIAKFGGNAAYGKTGQNPEEFKDYKILRNQMRDKHLLALNEGVEDKRYHWKADLRISEDPFIEIWSKKSKFHNNGYYNVGIAASVCSAARSVLLEGLRQAVEPIYCDTDSIFCRSFTGDVDTFRLGAWKLEAVADYAAIAAKKTYCLYDLVAKPGTKYPIGKCGRIWPIKWASKGGNLTPSEIVQVAKGGEVEKTNEAPSFSLSRGISFTTRKFRKTVDKPKKFK